MRYGRRFVIGGMRESSGKVKGAGMGLNGGSAGGRKGLQVVGRRKVEGKCKMAGGIHLARAYIVVGRQYVAIS